MAKHQEHIMAVPASVIDYQGPKMTIKEQELFGADLIIAQRAKLEQTPAYRQLIPYTVVRAGNKYGVYARTKKGNESRLHGQVSMGIGGHAEISDLVFDMNTSVVDLTATLAQVTARELTEEIRLLDGNKVTGIEYTRALILSSETSVDAVHVGLLVIVDLETEAVAANEDQIEWLGFKTIDEILSYEQRENWTHGLCTQYFNQ